MTASGPNTAGTIVQGAGGPAWSTPLTNINVSDDTRITSILQIDDISKRLQPSNFGFAIPELDIIDGIELIIELSAGTASVVVDSIISLTKVTPNLVGENKQRGQATFWPDVVGGDDVITFGGPTDKWETTWTADQINASTFGAVITAFQELAGATNAHIDFVSLTIYHHNRKMRNRTIRGTRSRLPSTTF